MRKIYLFALLTVMVFAFAGSVMAKPLSTEQQKAQEEALARPSISLSNWLLQNRTVLDETIIYETTFANADDWTVEDGGSDGYTWALVDTAQQSNRPMFQNGPFMWVDADEAPDDVHLIEGLISPEIDPGAFAYIYMLCDLEYSDLNTSDSLMIQYSNDGTTWSNLDILSDSDNDDISAYPYILDITEVAAGNGTFQIRFLYDDGNTWAWYAGVDNFQIIGSDEVLDLEPPTVEVTSSPASSFVGTDREILALAEDDATLASVTLRYGIVVDLQVPETFDVVMTSTENENEYTGVIPGTFGAAGDTIAFVVIAEDGAGNTTADPPEAGNAYIFELYPEDQAYQIIEMPSFDWLEVSTTGTDLALTDDSIIGLDFADFGFGTFTYFGETYDSVYVSSNGWVCFEPGAYSSPYTPPLPDTDNPNGVISLCGDDLNPTLMGHIYAGVVDGKFVIQYGGDTSGDCYFYDETMGITAQIVLDGGVNVAYLNYDHVTGYINEDETPYLDEHNMGIENPDGTIGVVLYQGLEYNFPVDQSSYIVTPPAGDISGMVYADDGVTPVEDAEIYLYMADGTDDLVSTLSAADGSYEFPVVVMGTYDIEVIAAGFETVIVEDVEVAVSESITQDFTLTTQSTTTTIQGYVYNADAAEETVVSGIDVYLVQYDMTATTDASGFFSFGDLAIGTYTFMVGVDPEGSTGFHNAVYPRENVVASNPDIAFDIFEILAPVNVIATPGEISVNLSWDAPENHMTEEVLVQMINDRREVLNVIDANPTPVDMIKAVPYRQELARLERRLAYLHQLQTDEETEVELDDINNFVEYVISVDGEVAVTTDEEEYLFVGLDNGTEYSFSVAADYGYGSDYLVWTDPVTATPDGIYLIDLDREFEWVDISETGTALNLTDDGITEALPLGGMILEHYGVMYTDIYVSSNGMACLVEPGAGDLNLSAPIPTEDLPNAVIAPLWDDFDSDDSDAENVWYQVDQANERVIIQWHTGPYPGPNTNIHDFELIIYPNMGEYVFSYLHSVGDWDYAYASVGFENETGLVGLSLNPEEVIADSTSIMVGFVIPPRGTVSGNVVDTDGNNVGNAEVWLAGVGYPIATTAGDGTFGPATVSVGTHDFTFVHDDYWSVEVEDIVVTEETNTVIPEVTMSYPRPRVNPSSLDVTFDLDNDEYLTETFDLFNDGSGPMEFVASVSIAGRATASEPGQPVVRTEAPEMAKSLKSGRESVGPVLSTQLDDVWDLITSFANIEDGTGAQDNLGIGMTERNFYISGFYYGTLTCFSYDGTMEEQLSYPDEVGGANYSGLFGLANDEDGYLYGGDENGNIFKFSTDLTEFNQIATIQGFYPVGVAYDYDNQVLYTAEFGDPFYAVDNGGNATAKAAPSMSVYGLAYVPMDEEGYTIYGHADDDSNSHIIRYNPSTNQWDENPIETIYDTSDEDAIAGGLAAGVSNTGAYDFMTLRQGETVDTADLWEGYTLQQWLSISPGSGTVQSGGSQQLTVGIDPSNDPNFDYHGGDEIYVIAKIAGPHMNDTTVLVTISFSSGAEEVENNLPQKYALHQNYPNPFNPTTEIKFDLVKAQNVKLVVFNMLGQEVARLVDAQMQAGFHEVTFDATRFASGVYFYRIETEAFTSMKKMVMVK